MFKQDESMLRYGALPVDNLFFQEYLPGAKGAYVKVYLYSLYLSQHPQPDMGLSQETVLMLLAHMISTRGVQFSFRSAQTEAVRMSEENVRTAEDAETYFSHSRALQENAKAVLRQPNAQRAQDETQKKSSRFSALRAGHGAEPAKEHRDSLNGEKRHHKPRAHIVLKLGTFIERHGHKRLKGGGKADRKAETPEEKHQQRVKAVPEIHGQQKRLGFAHEKPRDIAGIAVFEKVSGAEYKEAHVKGVGRKPVVKQADAAALGMAGNNKNHSKSIEKLEPIVGFRRFLFHICLPA